MNNKKLILSVVFLMSWCTVMCQSPHFQPYFLLKKNEPVQINAIFQDNTGYIWIGTNKGLFKFNGKNYRHLTRKNNLPDDNVTAIAQDSAGNVWTGFRNGNIGYINAKEKFTLFNPEEGSAVEAVSDILFDDHGVMWFSTLNDGLYYLKEERLYRLDETDGMPDLFVYDLEVDAAGSVWAGTDGGAVICRFENDKVRMEVLNYEDGLEDNIVKKIIPASDRSMSLATEDAGLINYNPTTKQFRSLAKPWPYSAISDFSVDGKNIWISTVSPGLLVYDVEHNSFKKYKIGLEFDPGAFTVLMHDREGNLWAGSRSGLVRTFGNHLVFIEDFETGDDHNVLAIAADKSGDLWYSTSEGLFRRSVNTDGKVVIRSPLRNTNFHKHRVISLYVDFEGFVWAGLYGQGALRIDPVSGKVTYLNKELRNGNVLQITGKGNTVWLATLGGSERITIKGNDFTVENFSTENGLSSDFIYQVFIDKSERVWFATDGKGIDMLDQKGIHHFEEGLPSKVVYGFAQDKHDQLWVNVQGSGIYRLNGSVFVALDSVMQLRDQNVNCLVADPAGNLLAMHDLGIDILDISKKRVRYFNQDAGIGNKVATLNAFSKDDRGNIFIGTDEGIVQYAAQDVFTSAEPLISIDAFKVFDQTVDLGGALSLNYDENSVTIAFSGLWYQHPEALTFLYKLENYDLDWIQTGDNAVTYSRLPAGDYTFKVKVSDNHDFNHAYEASIRFTVKPPFWQTSAFYILSAVIVASVIFGIVRYREKKLLHDKQVLEAKVEERTREIQRKTEEIQAQNEEIMAQAEEINGINENLEMLVQERTAELEKKNRALEEYAFINAHKLRSPLASILGLIHLLSKTRLDDETKIINEHLRQRADELDGVVRSITEAIERGERKEYRSKIDD